MVFGDNGQGKTTLIKTLCGSIDGLDGSYRWTHGAEVGVYAQHVYQQLGEDGTVIDYLQRRAQDGTTVQEVERLAGSFLFSGLAMQKDIKVLSGGERARLLLAGLLLGPYTVLILDEPTNHLDVETVDALGKALRQWNGTVMCVTHDRDFAQDLATAVIEVGDGRVRRYDGGVEAWLWMLQAERQGGATTAEQATASKPKSNAKEQARRRYELEKKLKSVNQRLATVSKKHEQAQQDLMGCTDSAEAEQAQQAVATLAQQQEVLEEEWLELSEELEALN